MPMNNAQNRVIDPINTNVAQGYRHPDHVGSILFPRVPVMVSGGKIIQFGKESFKAYSTHRAPGTATKRVTFGHEGKPYALENHALDGVVPREHQRDAQRVPGIDLSSRAVSNVMRIMSLSLEKQQADLATDTASYAANNRTNLTSTDKWSDKTGSTPISDVRVGRDAVRAAVGIYPNVMVLGPDVFSALVEHPDIVDRIKYSQAGIVTEELLARLFNVERVAVGKAIGYDDLGTTATDLWGKNAVLAYVPQSISGVEEPSYGYTYTMDGHPLVEAPYYDRDAKSWVYGMSYERVPVIAGMEAGYLITGAAA